MRKYFIHVYGCQMNVSDSERLAAILEQLGFEKTVDEAAADLIAVVACSVRQTAIDRIHGQAKQWKKWKQAKPLVTLLTGCVLPTDQEKLASVFDLQLKANELHHLPVQLSKHFSDLDVHAPPLNDFFDVTPKYNSQATAYVPISFGCNNFCSYCAVPFTRGRELSRPPQKIISEITALAANGIKEIVLLGQNVNSYGLDGLNVRSMEHTRATIEQAYAQARKSGHQVFPDLLQSVLKIPGEFWVRFLTSNPQDMSDQLINVMAESERIEPYVHLPLQAGNNTVLRRMNRRYTVASYFALLKRIRKQIPRVNVTTDVIVGFPGETEKQFNDTADACHRAKYTQIYIGKYSPRPGTTAAGMYPDDVSWDEKKRRAKILTEIVKSTALEYNKSQIGETIEMLVDRFDGKYNYGYTKRWQPIRFAHAHDYSGQRIPVRITAVQAWSLAGKRPL